MPSQPVSRLEQLTAASFFRLKVGEKLVVRQACQSADGRAFVAKLLAQFLADLPETSEAMLETAFLAGREMASLWPFKLQGELRALAAEASPVIAASFVDGLTSLANHKAGNLASSPPPLREVEKALDAIEKRGVSGAEAEVRALMARHVAHVEATGFSNFLSYTADKLSGALLKRPQEERFAGGAIAQQFLRESLKWEPWNARLWRNWAEAYLAQGGQASAEAILWEADRRFSDQPAVLGKLLRLIASDGERLVEAYELSLKTMSRFPRDRYLRNMYAHILLKTGRAAEAARVLAESLRANPNHDADITLFATALTAWRKSADAIKLDDLEKMLSALPANALVFGKVGRALWQQAAPEDFLIAFYRVSVRIRPDDLFLLNGLANRLLHSKVAEKIAEARQIFSEVLKRDEENTYARDGLARSEADASENLAAVEERNGIDPAVDASPGDPAGLDERHEEAGSSEGAPPPPLPYEIVRLARARRMSFRLGAANESVRDDALEELRAFLQEEPTFAYAQLLAVRQGIWEEASNVPMTFPAAFEAALKAQDARQLELLGNVYPHLEILTRAARAAYGDAEAANSLASLAGLDGDRPELERKVIQLVAVRDQAVGGSPFSASTERVLDALRELNEWALSGAWREAA